MSKVIHGKNGYLFLAGEDNAVINLHTGNRYLKNFQLSRWKDLFMKRKRGLKNLGIKYYLQIIPDKHCVYSQFLPEEVKVIKDRNIDLFIEQVEPVLGKRFNYPLSKILEESHRYQVYYKKDSHWTDRGAFIAYQELISMIKKDFPHIEPLNDPEFSSRYFRGDLARLLDIDHDDKEDYFKEPPSVVVRFNNMVRNTGRIKIFHNEHAKNSIKILLFGSSSSLYTLKYLSHDFKEVVFYWSGNFDYPIIKKFRPDLIINHIRERHLIRPANDTQGLTTTEMAFVKSFHEIGKSISPIPFNEVKTLRNCLAKAGNKTNKAYLKYLKSLCDKLKIEEIYHYAMNIDRKKIPYWVIKLFISAKIALNQVSSGALSIRLNRVTGKN